MNFDDVYSSDEISLSEVYDNQKEDSQKDVIKKQMKGYGSRPGTKERRTAYHSEKNAKVRLEKMDQDHHTMCKKLGKPMGHAGKDPTYFYRCRQCEVSYSEKEKSHFWKGNKCPCCHMMLRTRKTVTQKRKEN